MSLIASIIDWLAIKSIFPKEEKKCLGNCMHCWWENECDQSKINYYIEKNAIIKTDGAIVEAYHTKLDDSLKGWKPNPDKKITRQVAKDLIAYWKIK